MENIFEKLADAVVRMKRNEVERLSLLALKEGVAPEDAIQKGLAAGMSEVGRLFACKQYFVPEVLVCAKSMYAGFDILKDKVTKGKITEKGVIAIGVVDGDFHDIGKNIVKLMLEASGFRIIDLGKNVSSVKFVEIIEDENPGIVALSTLMTTTMDSMEGIVSELSARYPHLKFMIGGAPVSEGFARLIGAHFYGEDANQAVHGAHSLAGLTCEG